MTQPTDRPIMNLPVQEVFDNRNYRYQSSLCSWFVAWAMTTTDHTSVADQCQGTAFGVAYMLAGIMSDELNHVGTTREIRAVHTALLGDFQWCKDHADEVIATINGSDDDDPDAPSFQQAMARMQANQARYAR